MPSSGESYESDLMSLTKDQLIDLTKQTKKFLQLNTAGKNKSKLVEALIELHGRKKANSFYGKPLLGYAGSSHHITVPQRESLVVRKARKAEKGVSKQLRQAQTKQEKLAELRRKLNKAKGVKELEKLKKELEKLTGQESKPVGRTRGGARANPVYGMLSPNEELYTTISPVQAFSGGGRKRGARAVRIDEPL